MVEFKISSGGRLAKAAAIALLLLAGSVIASAQCIGAVCVYSNDYPSRYDGNDVTAQLYDSITGSDDLGYYEVCVDGTLYLGDSELADSGTQCADDESPIDHDFGEFSLPAAGAGPFEYILEIDYTLYC